MLYRRLFDLPGWRPRAAFGDVDQMRHQMERFFEAFSGTPFASTPAGVFPAINLTETTDSYYVRAELPGIKAGDLDIQVTGRNLSVTGERQIGPESQNARYHRREREGGKFSRVMTLPGEVDSERIEARLKNGILTIAIAKAEAARPKQITIR